MGRRIRAFILSGILFFTAMAESTAGEMVSLEPCSGVEASVTAEAPEALEGNWEGELPLRGGLLREEFHEIEEGLLPEPIETEMAGTERKGSKIYQNDWDQYSSYFYYNQLPEKCQELWDGLDALCRGYLTGKEAAKLTKTSSGKSVFLTKSVPYSGIPKAQMTMVVMMFKYSNPQYYFLDLGFYGNTDGVLSSSGQISFPVFAAFANGTMRQRATKKMKAVIDSWMAQIKEQKTDLEKEKKAHDLICEKVVYDDYYQSPLLMNPYNQVAYSVFCTGSTVCAGYSQAMQLLMNGAGIDCAVVTSLAHEWNIVRLNDSWYLVDLTWDDLSKKDAETLGQGMRYRYFNRSSQKFIEGTPEQVSYHTPELFWNAYLPSMIYDSGATAKEIGAIFTPSNTASMPQIISSGSKVTITSPSGGDVYYTTDGTDPSPAYSKANKYAGAITVSKVTAIRAMAAVTGYYDSQISDITVTPKFSVTFRAAGGYIGKPGVTSTKKTLACGGKISKLVEPKRQGYAFLGWYTLKSGGKSISAPIGVSKDVVYYAHWAKINPKKAVLSSVENQAPGEISVAIQKIGTASGYQIRYSLRRSMSGAKKMDLQKNKGTVNNLIWGRTYYVQARMYQKDSVSGKKKYGAYSAVKSVLIMM